MPFKRYVPRYVARHDPRFLFPLFVYDAEWSINDWICPVDDAEEAIGRWTWGKEAQYLLLISITI